MIEKANWNRLQGKSKKFNKVETCKTDWLLFGMKVGAINDE